MSAPRASETPSIAASPSTTARTVLLPGSPATYANRAFLRGLGLRWDPEGHRWHGTASAESVHALREQLGLEVQCFGSLEAPETKVAPKGPTAPRPVDPRPHDGFRTSPGDSSSRGNPRRVPSARTHLEARIAIPAESDPDEGFLTPTRRFTLAEITSGLPDDSREADERTMARRLHDLRGRVKTARALVSTTPGLAATLKFHWRKAALFYARFGITESTFRYGVAADPEASWNASSNTVLA